VPYLVSFRFVCASLCACVFRILGLKIAVQINSRGVCMCVCLCVLLDRHHHHVLLVFVRRMAIIGGCACVLVKEIRSFS
jgi:hypothetical protein